MAEENKQSFKKTTAEPAIEEQEQDFSTSKNASESAPAQPTGRSSSKKKVTPKLLKPKLFFAKVLRKTTMFYALVGLAPTMLVLCLMATFCAYRKRRAAKEHDGQI